MTNNKNILEYLNNYKNELENNNELIYKINTIKLTIKIIKKHNKEITVDNASELLEYKGIGKGTVDKIINFIKNKKNSKTTKIFKDNKLLTELSGVIGIGPKLAKDIIDKYKIKTFNEFKRKVSNNEVIVNDKIKLGLNFHNKYFTNIPRTEMSCYDSLFKDIIAKKNNYVYTICGSYRRGNNTSNDIDLLVSIKDNDDIDNKLYLFVQELKADKIVLTDITDKKYKTKYMGFIKLNDRKSVYRRIDIIFVQWKYYYSSLLYFTGSKEFNQRLRGLAKKKMYSLNEYGLYDIKNNKYIYLKSEDDIFKILDIDFIHPYDR